MATSCKAHNRFLTVVAALLVLATLTACEKPDQNPRLAGDQATFIVSSARGDGDLQLVDSKNSWQVPDISAFSFTTCLKDRASGETARGQRFAVEREDGSQIIPDEASDINGCIVWTENFPFNFFAQKSTRIPVTRQIVGQGVHSGKAEVRLAINPWALGGQSRDKGSSVIFLRDQILPDGQVVKPVQANAALSGQLSGQAAMWIPDVSVYSMKHVSMTDGQIIQLTLDLRPKVKLLNMNGEVSYIDLKSGEFQVIAHLIATDTGNLQKERVLLTSGENLDGDAKGMTGSAKLADGRLLVTLRTSLERRVSFGNLELALLLQPTGLGNLKSLKTFEGRYELGPANDISRNPRGLLSEDCREGRSTCTVADATTTTENFEEMKKNRTALDNDPYIFSTLKLRFVNVVPGETATQRTVAYTASTCIRDRWTGQMLADVPVSVDYLNEETNEPLPRRFDKDGKEILWKTNQEGCLNWDSAIAHYYYKPEQLFWRRVRISIAGTYTRTMDFALNPWDDKFTFGWDKSEFSDSFIDSIRGRKKIQSRFFLGSFGYHAVRFLYNIDRFLELEVKKTVLMELQPHVLRYSGIINARKQTESLRDGIYLLKVGIQKDYLDPADRRRAISNRRDAVPSENIEALGGEISRKEYITTSTQLVRVVDGKIIHPVELTMRDLRLMRVRSNFMLQLETVDEKLVAAHGILGNVFRDDLEALKKSREFMMDTPPEERELKLQELALQRKTDLESAFFLLKERLAAEGQNLKNLDIIEDDSVMNPLRSALETNDFTETKLASGENFDLNQLIEKDSGLERRSFVGPVIFLANAYSDSMRATDNLDEARCSEAIDTSHDRPTAQQVQDSENPYKWEELSLFATSEKDQQSTRQNNAYRFSKYYGSLKHLCGESVDTLIAREKEAGEFYKENMPLLSSMFNFVSLYNLDFVSLSNERVQKLNTKCSGHVGECMVDTEEFHGDASALYKDINKDFAARRRAHVHRSSDPQLAQMPETGFREDQVREAMFANPALKSTQIALCGALAGPVAKRLNAIPKEQRYAGWYQQQMGNLFHSENELENQVFAGCMLKNYSDDPALFVEDKLRVHETSNYTFLGGLQLNLNVGESFSVGRSDSWGYSFKPQDILEGPAVVGSAIVGGMLGGPMGAVAGAVAGSLVKDAAKILKPITLSKNAGMSSSDGTNVSQSTYLVTQIARFNLEISRYEYCRVVRFNPVFVHDIGGSLGIADRYFDQIARGMFVCSGINATNPVKVDESYFYFTQHFTEGDMLDQADLYNHPWLLALRGVREFSTFVNFTNAQEVMDLGNFTKGVLAPEKRSLGWPLAQMEQSYRRMLPTFPGLYTVVKSTEKATNYPLQERLTTADADLNAEIRCQLNASGICAEKLRNPPMQ